jgi:4-amino-4-deoxy-L-arabinose transferase-like glycosyltransferase
VNRLEAAPTRHHAPSRAVGLAIATGFALRLAFGLGYWTSGPLTHDEQEYLALARSVFEGRGFAYAADSASGTSEQIGRAPMYPLFLAGLGVVDRRVVSGPPASPTTVKIAQAVLSAGIIWLVAAVAMRAAGSSAGSAAAWIAALYPPLIWTPAYVFSETLFSLLALASAFLLDRGRLGSSADKDAGTTRLPVASGVLAGAAALTRPTMVFFLGLVVLWLVFRRRWKVAAAFVLGAAITIGPWTIRNVREYGRFVLIASQGGVTFWTGNHPLSPGEGDLAANPALKRANLELRQQHPGLSAEELERVYYTEAFGHIRRDPVWWASLEARKFFYTWVPIGPSYRLHSNRYFLATIVSYLILFPAAIVGFIRLRRLESQPYALWLLAASSVLTCLVFFPQERFRIPIIDPTLAVCAGALRASARPAMHAPGDSTKRGSATR